MCRLDAVISEFKVDSIDFLKIDVEGYEVNVLRNCGDSLKPERMRYIYFEFHRVNKLGKNASVVVTGHLPLGELEQLLEANGCRLLVIYTQGVTEANLSVRIKLCMEPDKGGSFFESVKSAA